MAARAAKTSATDAVPPTSASDKPFPLHNGKQRAGCEVSLRAGGCCSAWVWSTTGHRPCSCHQVFAATLLDLSGH
jgi:hypothetical protein